MRKPALAGQFDVAADINVTPMIDVMLVLLIIFMVVTPATVMASLPAAPERDRRLTLVVQRNGAFALDLGRTVEHVSDPALGARLAELYAARPGDHVLYLKADRGAGYDRVLTALDAARAAGVRRVGAITERAR